MATSENPVFERLADAAERAADAAQQAADQLTALAGKIDQAIQVLDQLAIKLGDVAEKLAAADVSITVSVDGNDPATLGDKLGGIRDAIHDARG